MIGGLWNTTEGARQPFRGQFLKRSYFPAAQLFREERSTGNGRRAPAAEKFCLVNPLLSDGDGQLRVYDARAAGAGDEFGTDGQRIAVNF